jgi:hypothetical protein
MHFSRCTDAAYGSGPASPSGNKIHTATLRGQHSCPIVVCPDNQRRLSGFPRYKPQLWPTRGQTGHGPLVEPSPQGLHTDTGRGPSRRVCRSTGSQPEVPPPNTNSTPCGKNGYLDFVHFCHRAPAILGSSSDESVFVAGSLRGPGELTTIPSPSITPFGCSWICILYNTDNHRS